MYYSIDFRHALGHYTKLPSEQSYHRHVMLIAPSLEDLEATRHQSLEDTVRVILPRNRLQLLVVHRPVAGENFLEASSIAPILVSTTHPQLNKIGKGNSHVIEGVVQTSLLRGSINLIGSLLNPLHNIIIILAPRPLDNLRIAQVHLLRVQAKSVAAALGRGFYPQRANGLPVQLDDGEVCGGDLGVELGEFGEEGAVDYADALKEFGAVGTGYGSGNKHITAFISMGFCLSGGGGKYLM